MLGTVIDYVNKEKGGRRAHEARIRSALVSIVSD